MYIYIYTPTHIYKKNIFLRTTLNTTLMQGVGGSLPSDLGQLNGRQRHTMPSNAKHDQATPINASTTTCLPISTTQEPPTPSNDRHDRAMPNGAKHGHAPSTNGKPEAYIYIYIYVHIQICRYIVYCVHCLSIYKHIYTKNIFLRITLNTTL